MRCAVVNLFPMLSFDFIFNLHFSLNNHLIELNDLLVQMMVTRLLKRMDTSWMRSFQ
jgi:hypothetical protein